jgi:hypothetical protein
MLWSEIEDDEVEAEGREDEGVELEKRDGMMLSDVNENIWDDEGWNNWVEWDSVAFNGEPGGGEQLSSRSKMSDADESESEQFAVTTSSDGWRDEYLIDLLSTKLLKRHPGRFIQKLFICLCMKMGLIDIFINSTSPFLMSAWCYSDSEWVLAIFQILLLQLSQTPRSGELSSSPVELTLELFRLARCVLVRCCLRCAPETLRLILSI